MTLPPDLDRALAGPVYAVISTRLHDGVSEPHGALCFDLPEAAAMLQHSARTSPTRLLAFGLGGDTRDITDTILAPEA